MFIIKHCAMIILFNFKNSMLLSIIIDRPVLHKEYFNVLIKSFKITKMFSFQVFVANSGCKNTEVSHPFGYLKASTNLTCVNLFVLPYNYPVLLPLLDDLFKVHRCKPTPEWKLAFQQYLDRMPSYYVTVISFYMYTFNRIDESWPP